MDYCSECGCNPEIEPECWFCDPNFFGKLHKKYVTFLNGKDDTSDLYDEDHFLPVTEGFVDWVSSPVGVHEQRLDFFKVEVRSWVKHKHHHIVPLLLDSVRVLSAHDMARAIGEELGLGETTPYGVKMKLVGLS